MTRLAAHSIAGSPGGHVAGDHVTLPGIVKTDSKTLNRGSGCEAKQWSHASHRRGVVICCIVTGRVPLFDSGRKLSKLPCQLVKTNSLSKYACIDT